MIAEKSEKLIELGLTEKEAAVYLTLLYGGEMTAEKAAKQAKLNRSTTYVQIKELMDMGLVSTFKIEKKTFFAAESPTNLERILEKKMKQVERQRDEALTLLPELLRVFSSTGARPVFRMFEGKEGLMSMRNSILNSGEKEVFIAFSFDGMSKVFTKAELMDWSTRRAAKNIHSWLLYTKTGDDIPLVPPQKIRRVDADRFPFTSDIYICGDTVSIASTSGQIVGMTITNAAIAKTLRSLYLLAWEHSDNQ